MVFLNATQPLNRRIPENPKYKHIKATIDTGKPLSSSCFSPGDYHSLQLYAALEHIDRHLYKYVHIHVHTDRPWLHLGGRAPYRTPPPPPPPRHLNPLLEYPNISFVSFLPEPIFKCCPVDSMTCALHDYSFYMCDVVHVLAGASLSKYLEHLEDIRKSM